LGRQASPGIAADPAGRRAVVISDATFVTVDLETLDVRERKDLQRRPSRAAKRIEGWGRRALWLGGDTIAVAGWTLSPSETRVTSTPIGVTLVELGSETRRVLDPDATTIELAGTTLLVSGGSALRGYRPDGTLRFELLHGADTGYVQTAGRWAYVGSENSTRFTVVDVLSGAVAATVRTPYPTNVLD
jgi:hypothetical protein